MDCGKISTYAGTRRGKMAGWKSRVICGSLLALSAKHILDLSLVLGLFKTVYDHRPGDCKLIPGVEYGSEDIETTSKGLAFISSGFEKNGKIFTFDFNEPDAGVTEAQFNSDYDTNRLIPLGLSLLENPKTGKLRVFIINYGYPFGNKLSVDIFNFNHKTKILEYKWSAQHENMYNINDIVAVGENQFYGTNDMLSTKKTIWNMVEVLSFIPTGNVIFFDGKNASYVAKGLYFANGIGLSPTREYLYAVSSFSSEIKVYKRFANNSLELTKSIAIGTVADNINVDKQSGALWIGAHSIPYKSFADKGPSQVLMIQPSEDHSSYEIREVFAENSNHIRGSSVASYYSGSMLNQSRPNQLLIGTVNNKMLYCGVEAF